MAKIICVHSYRRGTGKSHVVANVGALLAAEGRRVGLVDINLQSPSVHILFGVEEASMPYTLNDYLWGRCAIEQTAYDVTPRLEQPVGGHLFLAPGKTSAGAITRVLREGYDMARLNDGFRSLIAALRLDVLLIDTRAGLGEDTLLAIAIADALAIILRPDHQDYQGTGVIIDVARKLGVPSIALVASNVPAAFDQAEVRARIERAYNSDVAAVLPHSDEMLRLASSGIFVLRHPIHPLTAALRQVAARLAG
jgi:MinD-like ATPase involved in chromosome partitioning or flagellar assembly